MKIAKVNPFLLYIYAPLTLAGILLCFFAPQVVVMAVQYLAPIFLLLLLILALSPYGKQKLGADRAATHLSSCWRWLGLWFCLQISMGLIFWGLVLAIKNFSPTFANFPVISLHFFMASGFYPWPIYLLMAVVLSYSLQRKTVFKNSLTTTIRIGIDFYLQQGVVLAGVLTLSIGINQVGQIISSTLGLVMPRGFSLANLFLSGALYSLFATSLWRRYTRYLWSKKISLGFFWAIMTGLLICFILVFNSLLNFASSYFPGLLQTNPHLLFLDEQDEKALAVLFYIVWWICWMPFIAKLITQFASGRSIRANCGAALVLPLICLALYKLDQLYLHQTFTVLLSFWADNKLFNLILIILSLILTCIFFRDPKSLVFAQTIVTKQQQSSASSLSFLRNVCLLILSAKILYLLSNIGLLTPIFAGIAVPIFIISFMLTAGLARDLLA